MSEGGIVGIPRGFAFLFSAVELALRPSLSVTSLYGSWVNWKRPQDFREPHTTLDSKKLKPFEKKPFAERNKCCHHHCKTVTKNPKAQIHRAPRSILKASVCARAPPQSSGQPASLHLPPAATGFSGCFSLPLLLLSLPCWALSHTLPFLSLLLLFPLPGMPFSFIFWYYESNPIL